MNQQQARLAGVVFTPEVRPSFQLIDQAVSQFEDGYLQYKQQKSHLRRSLSTGIQSPSQVDFGWHSQDVPWRMIWQESQLIQFKNDGCRNFLTDCRRLHLQVIDKWASSSWQQTKPYGLRSQKIQLPVYQVRSTGRKMLTSPLNGCRIIQMLFFIYFLFLKLRHQ